MVPAPGSRQHRRGKPQKCCTTIWPAPREVQHFLRPSRLSEPQSVEVGARSPAASVPTGAPTCSPPSAPLSELPHAEASTPIRPFARPYAGSPFSNRVEQIRFEIVRLEFE